MPYYYYYYYCGVLVTQHGYRQLKAKCQAVRYVSIPGLQQRVGSLTQSGWRQFHNISFISTANITRSVDFAQIIQVICRHSSDGSVCLRVDLLLPASKDSDAGKAWSESFGIKCRETVIFRHVWIIHWQFLQSMLSRRVFFKLSFACKDWLYPGVKAAFVRLWLLCDVMQYAAILQHHKLYGCTYIIPRSLRRLRRADLIIGSHVRSS